MKALELGCVCVCVNIDVCVLVFCPVQSFLHAMPCAFPESSSFSWWLRSNHSFSDPTILSHLRRKEEEWRRTRSRRGRHTYIGREKKKKEEEEKKGEDRDKNATTYSLRIKKNKVKRK